LKNHHKSTPRIFILIALAWDNVFYNKSRTILVVILTAIAFSSIALFRGYTRYSSEGMKLGYIEKTGNFRIAPDGFWSHGNKEMLFEPDGLRILSGILNSINTVSMVNPIIEFSGIIGNEKQSQIFWGEAREEPNIGVTIGIPIFQGDDGFVIGRGLALKLGIDLDNNDESFVNIMSRTAKNGISLASFDVVGITDTGVPQNDEGLVIASREAILEFLGVENTASFVEVRLSSDDEQDIIIQHIKDEMSRHNYNIEIKTWEQLNPSFTDINALNIVQQNILTTILCILVFTALIQALSTAFKERLYEFGMLEAVGLKKSNISFLLIAETIFMSFMAIAFGLILTWGIAKIISILPITLHFPGYSGGYKLIFLFTTTDIIETILFIFVTCIFAMAGPMLHILRFQIAHLMYHSI
jgi:putative ABC transport system permease protein